MKRAVLSYYSESIDSDPDQLQAQLKSILTQVKVQSHMVKKQQDMITCWQRVAYVLVTSRIGHVLVT